MGNRFLAVCMLIGLAATVARALEPAEVLILVNRDVSISSRTANIYQQLRNVPPENVLRLALGANHQITREEYRTRIAIPVKKRLQEDSKIHCLLTTPGFPYTIAATGGKEDGAAVDSELAAVLRDEPADLNRWQPNPLYVRGGNPYGFTDPRLFQMVYVSRLDGPDAKTITRMVADAITVEELGLDGPVFADTQGLDGSADTAATDADMRRAVDQLSGAGFRATIDMNPETWRQPPGGVGEQAAGAAFYVGWYSLQNFQDIFGSPGLARGAIAWHVASDEAISPWSPTTREWCPNLLRRGAAVTLGPAFEPYLLAFPSAEVFVEQLLVGRTVAESYWLALPHVSWAMVLLGDPLYRPFLHARRAALVARAYVAETPNHVIEAGQSAPMLVRLECVGPAGSSTPALTASAEAGTGLAGASGKVTIPALQPGESVVVRVPQVTAGKDATGMFRLHLNVETAGETSRRVVVEGRTGFSLINGGAGRLAQMFVSPKGSFVISGQPGFVLVTETARLQTKRIRPPDGWALLGAAFSPDEAHVVLTLIQPQQKQIACILAETGSPSVTNLPPQTQFLRWLTNEKLLLKNQAGLIEYSIEARTSLPVANPDGWSPNSVIPGTDIVVLNNGNGEWAVRKGSAPQRRVLEGTPVVRDTAIADDLSQFGGLDGQGRLWAQAGWTARPEVIAEGVTRVGWGPISRRALVQTSNGEARIYDGPTRHWSPLGPVMLGTWSDDEKRLVYVTGQRRGENLLPGSLSVWDEGSIREICSMYRIGDVGSIVLTHKGESAFLLAGPNAGLEVWMLALPKTNAGK